MPIPNSRSHPPTARAAQCVARVARAGAWSLTRSIGAQCSSLLLLPPCCPPLPPTALLRMPPAVGAHLPRVAWKNREQPIPHTLAAAVHMPLRCLAAAALTPPSLPLHPHCCWSRAVPFTTPKMHCPKHCIPTCTDFGPHRRERNHNGDQPHREGAQRGRRRGPHRRRQGAAQRWCRRKRSGSGGCRPALLARTPA